MSDQPDDKSSEAILKWLDDHASYQRNVLGTKALPGPAAEAAKLIRQLENRAANIAASLPVWRCRPDVDPELYYGGYWFVKRSHAKRRVEKAARSAIAPSDAWVKVWADLGTALDIIKRLCDVIDATPGEAFKGWPSRPYERSKAALDFVYLPRYFPGSTAEKQAVRPEASSATASRDLDTLALAVAMVARRVGMCNMDAPITGPHLLMLLQDMEGEILRLRSLQPEEGRGTNG